MAALRITASALWDYTTRVFFQLGTVLLPLGTTGDVGSILFFFGGGLESRVEVTCRVLRIARKHLAMHKAPLLMPS